MTADDDAAGIDFPDGLTLDEAEEVERIAGTSCTAVLERLTAGEATVPMYVAVVWLAGHRQDPKLTEDVVRGWFSTYAELASAAAVALSGPGD